MGSGRKNEADSAFVDRFNAQYGDRGGVEKFLSLADDLNTGLRGAATHFGFTPAYASIAYRKIRGTAFSQMNPERVTVRRPRQKRINTGTVPGQAMAATLDRLSQLGVTNVSLSRRKSRIVIDGDKCLVLVRGAKAQSKTGGERTIQRYMYFNVTPPMEEDQWDFLIGVAFLENCDPRFYIVPSADLTGKTSVYIPVVHLKPTVDIAVGQPSYRPPFTGKYKFEKYREAWGPLLDKLGVKAPTVQQQGQAVP